LSRFISTDECSDSSLESGFDLSASDTVGPFDVGTYFYKCKPHCTIGMRADIIVIPGSSANTGAVASLLSLIALGLATLAFVL
jgi:hypothetical protein